MNYPNQGYGQQPGPQQNYGGYPPAPAAYPDQQQYQGPPPAQGYGPPQGYGQPAPQQAPPPPQPAYKRPTLEDWGNQPTQGASINSAVFPTEGSRVQVQVNRPVSDNDVDFQTDMNTGAVRTFRDGRPMLMLKLPVNVNSALVPDGKGVLIIKGQMQEEMYRAMAEAGYNGKFPEKDAWFDITRQRDKPPTRRGYNAQHIFSMFYIRPQGAAQQQPNGNGQGQAQQAPSNPLPQQGQGPSGQEGTGPYQPAHDQYAQQAQAQAVQAQAQWPAPGAPLSTPPQPAPPGTNPYNNPALPPNQPDSVQQPQYALPETVYQNPAGQVVPPPPQVQPQGPPPAPPQAAPQPQFQAPPQQPAGGPAQLTQAEQEALNRIVMGQGQQ